MDLQLLEQSAINLKKLESTFYEQITFFKDSLKKELFSKIFIEMARLQITNKLELQMWSFDDQPWSDGGATHPVSPCLRISYEHEDEPWFQDMEDFLSTIPDEVRFIWADSQLLTFDPSNQNVYEENEYFAEF